MLAILSTCEAQRNIDVRVHSHMRRLLCCPGKPTDVEELKITGLSRHLWYRCCDAGKLTEDLEEAGLSSDATTVT